MCDRQVFSGEIWLERQRNLARKDAFHSPSGNDCYIAIENGHRIVSFPRNMVDLSIVVDLPEGMLGEATP